MAETMWRTLDDILGAWGNILTEVATISAPVAATLQCATPRRFFFPIKGDMTFATLEVSVRYDQHVQALKHPQAKRIVEQVLARSAGCTVALVARAATATERAGSTGSTGSTETASVQHNIVIQQPAHDLVMPYWTPPARSRRAFRRVGGRWGGKRPFARGIPTRYGEYQMRSQLEAQVATLLDYAGLLWSYETEAFDLGGVRYLPDFYLPREHGVIEAKGLLDDASLEKVFRLAAYLDAHGGWVALIYSPRQRPCAALGMLAAQGDTVTPEEVILDDCALVRCASCATAQWLRVRRFQTEKTWCLVCHCPLTPAPLG